MAAPADAVGERLRAAADGGVLRFDRFVEIVLYSAGGFYDSSDAPFGPEGSFYTAAHTTPLFGAALARRLQAERERLGNPAHFRVVEAGPGDGTLALDVARALPSDGAGWEWTFVERSSKLRRALAERVRAATAATSVSFTFADSVSECGPFAGAVVANELLDALPFRRLTWRGGAWRELGVRWDGQTWQWAEGPDAPTIPGEALPPAEEESRYELLERADGFVREVADHLSAGTAIFLDYGASTDELLRGHRAGTLAAVRSHRPVEPLAQPGTADLSAFVDFTRLRAAAVRAGLVERAFRRQAEALGAWGFPQLLAAREKSASDSQEAVKLRLQAKNLLFGFETFHVLELGAPEPVGPTS
ncbi:MAG: SAM-dependent methyltransferase [Thermoplasmata archaeon]|nr:SAM-dependent methyltransferase [Thermoplasmata archaeon]MCI4355921.1 SAM-dependent methyltransferase [Thermoplasmata archaeon]